MSDSDNKKITEFESDIINPPKVKQAEFLPTKEQFIEVFGGGESGKYTRFVLAAMGSIPWVGVVSGILGAFSNLKAEGDQDKINKFVGLWLYEHQEKMKELTDTINEMVVRFESFDEEIQERLQSQEYLSLVSKGFRAWDQADTKEKRDMIKRLLMNAGGTKLCPDDLVRLFIDWIEQYHEAHFLVVAQINQSKGITRGEIWESIKGEYPQENSAEADLFRYLIRELSTGGVIRQAREVNYEGKFVRRSTRGISKSNPVSTMESAFETTKPYELTELGSQFVHYVMNDLVLRLKE